MSLLFNIKNHEILKIQLIKGKNVIDETHLTVGQDFDILLIRTLDNFFHKNKMERLSLKNVKISGKIRLGAVSSMILRTVAKALTI